MNKKVFKTVFEGKGLRMSHPRFLVYQELSNSGSPMTPQELYQCLTKKQRKIGLTSIYRSLDLFESLGIAFKIINGSNARYKLCESGDHHHHVVCKKCGSVEELNFCNITEWSRKVTESTGYQVTDHQLNFYGFCKTCRNI